nr:hypothetical protein [Tanacetum cinerariifolium]
ISVVQNASVVDKSDLHTEIERTKECFENCIIKKETEYAKLWSDWYKKCDECKYDKISYDKAYKDMQQKIERLQAQLGDLKGKSKDTSYVSDTQNQLSQKLEIANVELEFQEADASLAKHKILELEIKRLLKTVVNQDIISVVQIAFVVDTSDLQTELERMKECFENYVIKKETEYDKLWNDWYKKCDECKYDKISYDKAYKDMKQKIELLQAQLGNLKGKSKDTSSVSDTQNPLSQKLENKNVSDKKDNTQDLSTNTKFAKQPIVENLPKISKTNALSKPNSVSTPQVSKGVNNDKVIAPGMFRINPSKTYREEKQVHNTVSASARTKPITVSQPPVIFKKNVNSDVNGLSSTGVDNTKPEDHSLGAIQRMIGSPLCLRVVETRIKKLK